MKYCMPIEQFKTLGQPALLRSIAYQNQYSSYINIVIITVVTCARYWKGLVALCDLSSTDHATVPLNKAA